MADMTKDEARDRLFRALRAGFCSIDVPVDADQPLEAALDAVLSAPPEVLAAAMGWGFGYDERGDGKRRAHMWGPWETVD